jgi:hypothetical protein
MSTATRNFNLALQLAFSVAFFVLLKGEPGYSTLGFTIVTVFAMSTGQVRQGCEAIAFVSIGVQHLSV